MHQHNDESSKLLFKNLKGTVEIFGLLLSAPIEGVPAILRTRALLRRITVSFIALYEYLREKSHLEKEMHNKPLEEITEFFVKERVLDAEDKDSFIKLGSIYGAIRWPAPGSQTDTVKILENVPELYTFLSRLVVAHDTHPKEQESSIR